jgi:hypothetical protein
MNKWIIPIVLIVVSIGLMIGAVITMDKDVFKDVKHQNECDSIKLCKEDKNCCAIWQSGVCRRGKLNSQGDCVSKGDIVPALMLVFGIAFFIGFVVYLVKAIRHNK